MVGYVRKDTANNIADGNVVNASDLDNEFDGVVAAFNASTGHSHGGGTGEGSPILTMGPTQDVTVSATLLAPKTTNTVDIGSTALKFKDLYMAGNASIGGTLTVTGVATLGNGAVLGTPASGTVTNLTGTASININGTVGATTANTGAFTTLSASSTVSGTGFSTYLASPPAIGGTAAAAVSATTLTTSSTVTHNGGTANGVAYLNGSKVLTTGSALTFDGTNLGVGATSPATGVHLQRSSGNTYYRAQNNLTSVDVGVDGGGTGILWNNGNYPLAFGVNNSEQMRLTSTGLGIGTSSPSRKLSVSANATAAGAVYLQNQSASGYAAVETFNPAGTQTGALGYGNASVAVAGAQDNIYLYSATAITFLSGGTAERMRLDSAGNLGLGVTPSAWNAYKHIDVGAFNGIYGDNNSAFSREIGLYTNAYYSGGWKYAVTGSAANWFVAYNGTYAWNISASGTAGNAITFTQAMTLDASGNLLVGTTAALDGASRLAVSVTSSQPDAIHFKPTSNITYYPSVFINSSGTTVGFIQSTNTATVFSTTSDYRLKNVIGAVTGSGERIDALKPIEYEWKSDGSRTRGFLAHKFQEIYAGSVTGTKDATDVNGKPIYQGLQAGTSEVIADLVAEIQSLRKRLAALETK